MMRKKRKKDVMKSLQDHDGQLSKNPHVTLKRAFAHPLLGRFWRQSAKAEIQGMKHQSVFLPGKL